MQLFGVDPVGGGVGADRAAVGVIAEEAHGLEGEGRAELGEVLEDVVGPAAVAGRAAEDVREAVLRRPLVDQLDVVDEPVPAGDDPGAHGAVSGGS